MFYTGIFKHVILCPQTSNDIKQYSLTSFLKIILLSQEQCDISTKWFPPGVYSGSIFQGTYYDGVSQTTWSRDQTFEGQISEVCKLIPRSETKRGVAVLNTVEHLSPVFLGKSERETGEGSQGKGLATIQ